MACRPNELISIVIAHSRRPDSPDSLGQTNIVRLKFVETDSDNHCGGLQPPHQDLAHARHTTLWDIVDNDGPVHISANVRPRIDQYLLEANVGVDENGCTEKCVRGRIE